MGEFIERPFAVLKDRLFGTCYATGHLYYRKSRRDAASQRADGLRNDLCPVFLLD